VPTTRSTRRLLVRRVDYTFAMLTLVRCINYIQLNAAPDKAKCFSYYESITLLLMYTRYSGGFALKYKPYPRSGGFALKNIHLPTLRGFTLKICVYSRSGVLMKGYDSHNKHRTMRIKNTSNLEGKPKCKHFDSPSGATEGWCRLMFLICWDSTRQVPSVDITIHILTVGCIVPRSPGVW
jgi:hypothetical protein